MANYKVNQRVRAKFITKQEGRACLRAMRELAEEGRFHGYPTDAYHVVGKLDDTPYGSTLDRAETREEAAQHALMVLALCVELSKEGAPL